MGEPGRTTTVTILGEEYSIRGGSAEEVALLAAFVDEKFRELRGARPGIDLKRLAVMVSLNIAEELFQGRTRSAETMAAVLDRARRCRRLLEDRTRDCRGSMSSLPICRHQQNRVFSWRRFRHRF